jgi:glutamyl-tRNA synthetase
LPTGESTFQDQFHGAQALDAKSKLGDFVIGRSYGGTAYQLAVVVDDHDMGVNQIVRGDDLIYSTHRQLALYDALDWEKPEWFHIPLVIGQDGRRLAKRHGDSRLSTYREQGVAPESIVGYLARSLDLTGLPAKISARSLLERLDDFPSWQWNIPNRTHVFAGAFD